jgi:Ca2+-binding EF-hand superfamily protein
LNIQPDSNLDSELNNNTIPESDGLNHFDSLLMNQNSEDNSQYKEIEEAFLAFDKECEGAIPTYKLATVMRTLGQNPTKEELEDIIKEYDKDENGTIDLSEFKTLMINKLKEQESSEILIQIFKMFDKNDDGFIDFSDIKYILESIDYDFEEPNLESIIKAMIRKAGKNINDQMNFQEFKRILLGTNNKENLNEK